jgi:hypothetical protein
VCWLTLRRRRGAHLLYYRARVGYRGPRAGDVASCAGSGRGGLAAVFHSVFPEHRPGRAAQRARATECVSPPPLLPVRFHSLSSDLIPHVAVRAVPPEVLKLKGRRGELGQIDCESGCRTSSVPIRARHGYRVDRWLITSHLWRSGELL